MMKSSLANHGLLNSNVPNFFQAVMQVWEIHGEGMHSEEAVAASRGPPPRVGLGEFLFQIQSKTTRKETNAIIVSA